MNLHDACDSGNIDAVILLVLGGADVNVKVNGETSLHTACRQHYECYCYNIVDLLISHGADVNEKDNDGWTPLHNACYFGHHKIAKLLISHGTNVNSKSIHNNTPLHMACICVYDGYNTVKLLIEYNANILITNNNKQTPLIIAQTCKRFDIYELLEKEEKKRIYITSLIINNDIMKHIIIKKLINLS